MTGTLFWERETDGRVRCTLCHQHCLIKPGARGLCGVRENRDGQLDSLVYGRPIATAVDPIEKKPLYHVLPGSSAFSIGTFGCNFRCLHCQNCTISQAPSTRELAMPARIEPAQIVAMAVANGCASIAYTYTEPTIFYEYAYDIARLARDEGLRNLFVTNGYMMPEALVKMAPYLDAANIDLKGFRDDRYRELTGARLAPILETIRLHRELGIWIEITTLVIPGVNDDTGQLRALAEFIAGIDTAIPWHVSAFHPAYKLTAVNPTPRSTLETARAIGRNAGLAHVYLGNVSGPAHTACSHCGAIVIERNAGRVRIHPMDGDCCQACGTRLAGIWS